ncbi:MAG: 1-acyl-sn-glycerol-3-phosphate acyltransferase [Saprospiraceae bacterium]|nr:1-acyl-sn-glycerol-3-phosphate acyltransferase [Saprospiraceae bacterium]
MQSSIPPGSDDKPYILDDALVGPYLQELFENERFVAGMRSFMPPDLFEAVFKLKSEVKSIEAFQAKIILPVMKLIERLGNTTLSNGGLEQLDPGKQYLFISNHRDIVLDSAFLNTTLFERGFRTSQIAIGDNLMRHRVSELIFRLNKSFVVKRSGTPLELYRYSVLLSEHIRLQITQGIDSVWIAQREGRAKDGNDRTQTGLLKMLSLGHDGGLKTYFQSLQIVPVSISYEYDPCDLLKAQEFVNKQADPNYKKSFEEDLQHMILGLSGKKGRVHFHFGKPLHEELDVFDTLPNAKKQLEALAEIIDHSIHQNYAIHGINEVAHRMLTGDNRPLQSAAPEEIEQLTRYFEERSKQLKQDESGMGRQYLLAMYANPLINLEAARHDQISST